MRSSFKIDCFSINSTTFINFTAAHCLKESTPPRHYRILLGAYDLDDHSESGRSSFDVAKLIFHQDWNPATLDFTGDIALIKLAQNVVFSDTIIPICLPSVEESSNILEIEAGFVVGWGQFDNTWTTSNLPRKTNDLPIIKFMDCVRKETNLGGLAWTESFCAGKERRGVCEGDSGSGYYVQLNGRYYLRGIVSSAIRKDCSESFIALFSDVLKYMSFITEGQVIQIEGDVTLKNICPSRPIHG